MKTTIELPDELLKQVRAIARTEGTSMRQIMEEGLQRALQARRATRTAPRLDFPVYGGSGLTEAFTHADWASLRDEIYRQPTPGKAIAGSSVHDRD